MKTTTPAPIQITHDSVPITYDEHENKWLFTLRGRDRSASSLAEAKAAIDKPVVEKAKPFEKIPAWWLKYPGNPEKVEITGIAEKGYREQEVWIKCSEGRKKECLSSFFGCNEKNDAMVASIIEKNAAASKLEDESAKLSRQLAPLKLEIPE